MPFRHLHVRRDDAVEYLTLNRPEVRNAFNDEMIEELRVWAGRAGHDARLRAVVLKGAGDHFCAGADIAWMARMVDYSEEENVRDAEAMSAMFRALDSLHVPLVAGVQGAALGGGTGLAAVSDVVVATEDSIFGFTEVKLGVIPAVISPFALAKIGVSAARELMLTGTRFDAVRAQAIGLVHAVVPRAELDVAIGRYLREILDAAPGAIAAAKALIRQVAGRSAADVADLTSRAIARQRVSDEGQDGMFAFLEKRLARWRSLP